jgi:TM2 domain-containing membrane protein YozV
MIYLLAVLLPFLAVMLRGKVFTGIVLLLLQLTFYGWLIAAPLAIIIVMNADAERRNKKLVDALNGSKASVEIPPP